ncbi:MAG: hypothetical protein IJ120_07680 [Solobacterium sp.]|nr:hypothetical protein [Solobacterium sp.]
MKKILWIVTLVLLMITGAFGNAEIVLAEDPSLIVLPQSKSAAPELKVVNGYNNAAGSYILRVIRMKIIGASSLFRSLIHPETALFIR